MRCEAAACAYEFLDSAAACRRGARAEGCVADSRNSSAFFVVVSLQRSNLVDRK